MKLSKKNVIQLISGNGLGQLVGFISLPFLTSLYSVEAFGIFGLYFSIFQIIGTISALRYELAILLTTNTQEATNVSQTAILVSAAFNLIITPIISCFLFVWEIERNLQILALIPLSGFFITISNIYNYHFTVQKKVKFISLVSLLRATLIALIQVIFGYFGIGYGLVYGFVLAYAIATTIYSIKFDWRIDWEDFNFKMKGILKRYKKFPTISLWGVLLNSISLNGTNIIFKKFSSEFLLGVWSTAFRYFTAPVTLIGNAYGQIYLNTLVQADNRLKLFRKSLSLLLIIGLFLFIPPIYFIDSLITIFLGPRWIDLAIIYPLLVPYLIIRLIHTSLSLTLIGIERQEVAIVLQVLLLGGTLLSLYFSDLQNLRVTVTNFSYTLSIIYIINISVFYKFLKIHEK